VSHVIVVARIGEQSKAEKGLADEACRYLRSVGADFREVHSLAELTSYAGQVVLNCTSTSLCMYTVRRAYQLEPSPIEKKYVLVRRRVGCKPIHCTGFLDTLLASFLPALACRKLRCAA
jgi:hypothetical protein